MTPSSGISVGFNGGNVTFGWNFSSADSDDYQTQYEIQVWQTSNQAGTTVDTGVVATPQQSGFTYSKVITLGAGYKDVQLGWKVRVWDADNIVSAYSADQLFFARDPATIAITSPTNGGTVTSQTPTMTWTYSATGGRTQAQYRVTITNNTTGVAVYTTGFVVSAATSFAIPANIITTGVTYSLKLEVIDSSGILAATTNTFSATYTLPTTPTYSVSGSSFSTGAQVQLAWNTATVDANFYAWRVYRRNTGDTTWTLLKELPFKTSTIYYDYLCPSGVSVDYAVVQAGTNAAFGSVVESAYSATTFVGSNANYWIVVPDATVLNIRLDNVTADQIGTEVEEATLNLLGRGRRFETGTRFGVSGTLTVQIFDDDPNAVGSQTARQKKNTIEQIRTAGYRAYLRNPFGDVWSIGVINARYDRLPGVGQREYVTATIEYSEIVSP
jgi:hypothetical protein